MAQRSSSRGKRPKTAQRTKRGVDIRATRGLTEWIILYQAYNAMFKVQEVGLLPFKISLPQLHVLSLLTYAGGELTTGEIGRAMVKASQTITGLVDRLEVQNLVERRFDRSDRRKTWVRLTDAGRERFAKAFPATNRLGAELFSALTDEELAALRAATSKIREVALQRLGVSLEGL
jgi:DNA-binding MarR family transcriptional regulator